MKPHPWRVAIVGAGRVGLAFGRTLVHRGDRVVAVVSRSMDSARMGGKFLRCANAGTSLESIPASTNLILITTPHDAIAGTAAALARLTHLQFPSLCVCHASGMLTADVLEPLAKQGATVFSFHPLQTFPRDFPVKKIVPTLSGIWYGVDGPADGVVAARRLARRLGGKMVFIPPDQRVLYHAACVVASNHLTALLRVLEQMHHALGIKGTDYFSLFRPIIETTMRNVALTSPAKALSGPVARGGTATLAGHFESVKTSVPELLPYISVMTDVTAALAREKGSISKEQAAAIHTLVQSYRQCQTPSEITK